MDFVILKVNGQDVSNSSHEDAVRCFQSAQEPIIVEVLRRQPGQVVGSISNNVTRRNENDKSIDDTIERGTLPTGNGQMTTSTATTTTTTTTMTTGNVDGITNDETTNKNLSPKRNSLSANSSTFPFVSTGVQTDWAGLVDEDELFPVSLNPDERTNDSFEDFLTHDIDFEEVTLRKTGNAEKLGLTVCYSSGSSSEDADTEVYISEIIPESLAARDGRLREGDQILRVNGKDVANKEQTENLFAETNNAVTILVSRCLYQDDDYDDRRLYIRGSPPISPDNIPAYQNSMIEQLIRQQQQQQQQPQQFQNPAETNNKENDGNLTSNQRSVGAPPVPSHTSQNVTLIGTNVPQNSSSTCSSQNSQKSGKSSSSPAHQNEDRKQWLQDALKECTKRVETMGPRSQQLINPAGNIKNSSVKLVEAYSSHVWSDTEHIYETIPESDNEPIYSSPYEHRQQWMNNRERIIKHCEPNDVTTGTTKAWNSSSKSNSSGEEKDSSSAYNTGESCHSNPLTLELHQIEKPDCHKSTLVLCTPTTIPAINNIGQNMNCSCPMPIASQTGKAPCGKSQTAKKSSQHHQHHHHQQQQQQQHHHRERDGNGTSNATLPADTMYTNVANLQQTMMLQQQLFKQALNRKNIITREAQGTRKSKSHGNFQAPNLTQYQFIGSQQICATTTTTTTTTMNSWNSPDDKNEVQMEWKVKRRPDGTRYIARRPIRSRVLRNRAIKISEERAGHTTEDDTMSEMKVGRYWSKEERKRQLERARERKQRQQETFIQQQLQQCNNEQPLCELNEEKSPKKPLNIMETSCKKTSRKKAAAIDDFTTVQEILVHGNRVGTGGVNATTGSKLMGLLSVTTV